MAGKWIDLIRTAEEGDVGAALVRWASIAAAHHRTLSRIQQDGGTDLGVLTAGGPQPSADSHTPWFIASRSAGSPVESEEVER